MVHIDTHKLATPLKKGDEFIVVASSSLVKDESTLKKGIEIFKEWGLIPRPHNIIGRNWGYLAGSDSVRYKELHPKYPAPLITFARGGWGSARLLEQNQPWEKGIVMGFSDVSALLLARLAAGFDGCIHGPLVTSLSNEPKWSQERLKSLLFGCSVDDLYGEGWRSGLAKGPLIVTNLTVASHLLGSKHFPKINGSILILEDIGEAPYRIDRMLTQWRLAGVLQNIAGIGFGDFKDCDTPQDENSSEVFQLKEVLKERTKDLDIPVVFDLPVGHCKGNAALPLGHMATLDGNSGILSLESS